MSELGPPPPLPQWVWVCIPPLNQRRGEHTRLWVRGWGVTIRTTGEKTLAHFAGESLAALSTLSCQGGTYISSRYSNCLSSAQPNRLHKHIHNVQVHVLYMWNMYNRRKPPYFSLNIRLLFSDLFRIRIRIRIRNVYFGSGSDPDPAKSFGSFRIRIRNTAFGAQKSRDFHFSRVGL